MYVFCLSILIFINVSLIQDVVAENCDEIRCSNVFDNVCGFAKAKDGSESLNKYHNLCYLNKIRCLVKSIVDLHQVEDALCDIEPKPKRRSEAMGIVGTHQVCNHTCPAYCVDTYEPACAQIWQSVDSSIYKPMINHCHIDLFSCVMGVNVTIHPLNTCFSNPSGLLFMSQVAGMQSLGLIENQQEQGRRSGSNSLDEDNSVLYSFVPKEVAKSQIVNRLFRRPPDRTGDSEYIKSFWDSSIRPPASNFFEYPAEK